MAMPIIHPKALLLFGLLARHLAGDPGTYIHSEIDLLIAINNPLLALMRTDYGC